MAAKAPKKVSNTPKKAAKAPKKVTNTPKKAAKAPKKVTNTPKKAAKAPKKVTNTPKKAVKVSKRILNKIENLKSARGKKIANYLVEHGSITTSEITKKFSEKHPPSAVRDLRDAGFPVKCVMVPDPKSKGKRIGKYTFGKGSDVKDGTYEGRKIVSKTVKNALITSQGNHCAICGIKADSPHLSPDHRVPFRIAGNTLAKGNNQEEYMLLCRSCQRAKSFECEHCKNYQDKEIAICKSCYWCNPEKYEHIATKAVRRLEIIWNESEIEAFNKLIKLSEKSGVSLKQYIKDFSE
jgi:hypothetical protein